MTHALIEKARARKQAQEDAKRRHEAFDARYQEAYDELKDRERTVGFPDYEGSDSYEKIRQDRLALDEHKEASKIRPYRVAHGEEVEPTTGELLKDIRDGLDRG